MVEMTRHVTTAIRYDGPATSGGVMDVQDLAPALLALAEIAKIANQKFNGDRASIKVLVNADIENKCFHVDLSLVLSWMDQAKLLIGHDNVVLVEQLAKAILGTGAAFGSVKSLFEFYKWIATKAPKGDQITYQHDEANSTVQVTVHGDGNTITVDARALALARDPKVLPHVKTVVRPLVKGGYDDFSIYAGDVPTVTIDKATAAVISAMPTPPAEEIAEDDSSLIPIRTVVFVKTQRNEGRAQWELKWAARAEWASIDDTDWLARFHAGQVPVALPLYLDVDMEMKTSRSNPDAPATFRVVKVHDVIDRRPGQQGIMFDADA